MSQKNSINLFRPELLPEQAFLTLSRVTMVWLVVLLVMFTVSLITQYQVSSAEQHNKTLKVENKQYKKTFSSLEQQLKARRTDSRLANRLEMLKMLMLNKQAFYQQLTDPNRTYVMGFSSAMTELSELHHREISLQEVQITNDDLTFSGLARRPEAVPEWLAGFEKSAFLSGKAFNHFKLFENEEKITEFIVSSTNDSKD